METTRSAVALLLATAFLLPLFISNVEGVNSRRDKKNFEEENGFQEDDEGVLGTIKNGFKMAGKFLGIDAASGVANLVAEAFGESNTPPPTKSSEEESSWGKTLLSGLMRALSMDTGKISAIVLNAIIFLAQLLTTSIVPKNPALTESPRKVRDGTPIEWILKNPTNSVQSLIEIAQDENLVDHTIEILKENTKGTDTSCLQLLLCKMAPFVWKMQRALKGMKAKFENGTENDNNYYNTNDENNNNKNKTIDNRSGKGENRDNDLKNEDKIIVNNDNIISSRNDNNALFRYLPEVREFMEHGDMCENRYDKCRLID